MFKIFLTFIFLPILIFVNTAKAKVTPKNYDFTFDKFKTFYPGKTLEEVKKVYKKVELIKKSTTELYRTEITHVRYKFPIYFQIKDGAIIDFYARLPNYFIHDIFHQSLINRFGKQDKFLNKDGTSFYVWKKADRLKITYSGTCTITCFPVFVHGIKPTKDSLRESFLDKMNDVLK